MSHLKQCTFNVFEVQQTPDMQFIQEQHTLQNNTHTLQNNTLTLPNNTHTIPNNTYTLPNNTPTLPNNTHTLPHNTHTLQNNTHTLQYNTQTHTQAASVPTTVTAAPQEWNEPRDDQFYTLPSPAAAATENQLEDLLSTIDDIELENPLNFGEMLRIFQNNTPIY